MRLLKNDLAGSVLISKWPWQFLEELAKSLKKVILSSVTEELNFFNKTIHKPCCTCWIQISWINFTAQKIKFYIQDFFSKCDQIPKKRRIWSHLLKKSLIENIVFCAVFITWWDNLHYKVGSVLQRGATILQTGTGITKWGKSYYKVGRVLKSWVIITK